MNVFSITSNLWRWRLLVGQLARREFSSRYAGSALGAAWAVLEPAVQFSLYFLVFPVFLGMRLEGRPGVASYGFFLASGLVPFLAFQESVIRSIGLARGSAGVIRHVNVPLEVMLAGALAAIFARQGVALLILAVVSLVAGTLAWAQLPYLCCAIALLLLLTLGVSLILVPAGAFLPDLGQAITTGMTVLFFLTPIVYPPTLVPERFRGWLMANPLVGVLDGFRAAFSGESARLATALVALAWALGAVLLGGWLFVRRTRAVRDIV